MIPSICISKYSICLYFYRILLVIKIYSIINKPLTSGVVTNLASQQIRDNINADVMNNARKLFQEMDRNDVQRK